MSNLQEVLDTLRPAFEYQVQFVKQYLTGKGFDIGCGNCPLMTSPDIMHFDISPQPLAVQQVGKERFVQRNCEVFDYHPTSLVDFIFSSHMVEDLPTKQAIIDCIVSWCMYLKEDGYLVLMLPDMQGGRYWTVEEGGNPSHNVNVGSDFIHEITGELLDRAGLVLIQMDTIPHDKSCSIDVVFKRENI